MNRPLETSRIAPPGASGCRLSWTNWYRPPTQPALSHQIAALERELGTPVIERQPRPGDLQSRAGRRRPHEEVEVRHRRLRGRAAVGQRLDHVPQRRAQPAQGADARQGSGRHARRSTRHQASAPQSADRRLSATADPGAATVLMRSTATMGSPITANRPRPAAPAAVSELPALGISISAMNSSKPSAPCRGHR
jgi:hypothetical protein